MAFGLQIEDLPSDHSVSRSERGSKNGRGMDEGFGRKAAAIRNHLERERQERVTGQNGRGFSKLLVARWTSTPEVVVGHSGQIIVNQGIGMHHLDRRRDRQYFLIVLSVDGKARNAERRSQTLSSRKNAVAHCAMDL